MTNLPGQRPAETAAIAASIALLICKAAGVNDPDTLTAMAVVIGFIPAAVTWIVVTLRKRSDASV
jgi:hypothetical protein